MLAQADWTCHPFTLPKGSSQSATEALRRNLRTPAQKHVGATGQAEPGSRGDPQFFTRQWQTRLVQRAPPHLSSRHDTHIETSTDDLCQYSIPLGRVNWAHTYDFEAVFVAIALNRAYCTPSAVSVTLEHQTSSKRTDRNAGPATSPYLNNGPSD